MWIPIIVIFILLSLSFFLYKFYKYLKVLYRYALTIFLISSVCLFLFAVLMFYYFPRFSYAALNSLYGYLLQPYVLSLTTFINTFQDDSIDHIGQLYTSIQSVSSDNPSLSSLLPEDLSVLSPKLMYLSIPILFMLSFILGRWSISGGLRPGQEKSKNMINSTHIPFLFISPSSLLDSFRNLFSNPQSYDVQHAISELISQIQTMQDNIDYLISVQESIPVAAYEMKPEPLSSVAPDLYKKIAGMSPEEAAKELRDEVARRKEERKKPVPLTVEEQALSPDALYLKMKTRSIVAREAPFLDHLQGMEEIPSDVRTWSTADVERWFLDERHEQWGLRKIRRKEKLYICPGCDRARDPDSHTCVGVFQRRTTRSGVPVRRETYLSTSKQGFRVGQRTKLDTDRIEARRTHSRRSSEDHQRECSARSSSSESPR